MLNNLPDSGECPASLLNSEICVILGTPPPKRSPLHSADGQTCLLLMSLIDWKTKMMITATAMGALTS